MKDQNGWDRSPRGTILAHPMTGFQASEQGLTVVLRVEWTESVPGSTRRRERSVQLHLPPETAAEIGRNLVRIAPQHGAPSEGKA